MRQFFKMLFGFFRILPEIGCLGFGLLLFNYNKLFIDVKDASLTHPGVQRVLLSVRVRSWGEL
jgi:hypothetical protein